MTPTQDDMQVCENYVIMICYSIHTFGVAWFKQLDQLLWCQKCFLQSWLFDNIYPRDFTNVRI